MHSAYCGRQQAGLIAKTTACLSLFSLLLTLPVAAAGQQSPTDVSMQVVSKHYSSGYLPVTGSYVEYEVRLENQGEGALENGTLEVSLVSADNETHSSAAYSVPLLSPGEGKTLHLGPFRMEGEGGHRLIAEMDGATLDYEPDSFAVYRQEAVHAALVAISLIAAGAGLAGFSLYRRRKTV